MKKSKKPITPQSLSDYIVRDLERHRELLRNENNKKKDALANCVVKNAGQETGHEDD